MNTVGFAADLGVGSRGANIWWIVQKMRVVEKYGESVKHTTLVRCFIAHKCVKPWYNIRECSSV